MKPVGTLTAATEKCVADGDRNGDGDGSDDDGDDDDDDDEIRKKQ